MRDAKALIKFKIRCYLFLTSAFRQLQKLPAAKVRLLPIAQPSLIIVLLIHNRLA